MILANIDLYTILYTRNNLHYNPLKDIASFRCGSIANLCTPVRFRYSPPQHLVDVNQKLPSKTIYSQNNSVHNSYTKLDVNFCRFMLLHKNRYLWDFGHELRRRIYPNTQEAEAG